ncbi:MAG: ornithine decarboxylase [Ghiorsea sp.]
MIDFYEQRLSLWETLYQEIVSPTAGGCGAQFISLYQLERYWAFPGYPVLAKIEAHLNNGQRQLAENLAGNTLRAFSAPRQKAFIPFSSYLDVLQKTDVNEQRQGVVADKKPCFELLVLHPDPERYFHIYNNALVGLQSDRDEFLYDLVFVKNVADAMAALFNNPNIQACVAISGCSLKSDVADANPYVSHFDASGAAYEDLDAALAFNRLARKVRPEVEHYYISETPFAELPHVYFEEFHRVFYYDYPFKDLHYSVLNAIRDRYNTPFYHALLAYAKKPKHVFHALPISQGSSLKNSVWVNDFYQFFGNNIFDAETSGTQGGLDSLLNPKGPIKNAQNKAQKAFGSDKTFFVTNGTSTSNKIVMQANLRPGDIVFVSSDCHKSVPYGTILSGVNVHFMQTNAVEEYDLYGAVPLAQIVEQMLLLKAQGLLHKLKQIVLTNSTFDGLTYDVEHYMMTLLAIKTDLIFHWDEAWYAHAHFNPLYRHRHAMAVAQSLRTRFQSESYRKLYQTAEDKTALPDPDQVKLRVYATQSTHKTLSSFRQGSMIHIIDECFNEDCFLDAYFTHTSTSPNYEILASLDVARRQMALEGYALTQQGIRLAKLLRKTVATHFQINQVFKVLTAEEIYPLNENSTSSNTDKMNSGQYIRYQNNGMCFDPTRVTLDIRNTGLTGGQFRKLLIDRYNIQVNKTSRHTVLLIINIGATDQSINHLLRVLTEISERMVQAKPTTIQPSDSFTMPQKRHYHARYQAYPNQPKMEDFANIRNAYYDAYNTENIEYVQLTTENMKRSKSGETWVSATFVTPYPPGFPLLVPGQIIDHDVLLYISKIVDDEIHGFHKELGLKVLKQTFLQDET